jgi:hypothetical protein
LLKMFFSFVAAKHDEVAVFVTHVDLAIRHEG